MNAHDPEGLRAVAASHLISACNKHELKDISKSQIFDLRQEGFDAFCEASVMIDGEISQISQMMQLLCLPQSCVVGPLTFKEFEDILSGDTTLPPRHTWIIIVKTNALSLDEVVSPAEESTGCMECKDIQDHFQVFGTTALSRRTSCRLRFGWWGGPNISRRVAASTSGGASRQYSWMQHPSLPRRSAQIDPWRIPEGPVAHGLSRTSRGGPTRIFKYGTHRRALANVKPPVWCGV